VSVLYTRVVDRLHRCFSNISDNVFEIYLMIKCLQMRGILVSCDKNRRIWKFNSVYMEREIHLLANLKIIWTEILNFIIY